MEKVSNFKSRHEELQLTNQLGYIKEIYKFEGVRGFFKGFSMNLVKAPIGAGIVHSTNELLNKMIFEYRNNHN